MIILHQEKSLIERHLSISDNLHTLASEITAIRITFFSPVLVHLKTPEQQAGCSCVSHWSFRTTAVLPEALWTTSWSNRTGLLYLTAVTSHMDDVGSSTAKRKALKAPLHFQHHQRALAHLTYSAFSEVLSSLSA